MDIVVTIFLVAGLCFFTGGAVGILRLPEFYSRLHAAGQLDTMGALFTMVALALHVLEDFSLAAILTGLKIVLIVLLLFMTGPTATHAIVDAGVRAGLLPWRKPVAERKDDLAD
ncbi:MAG: monovalent cation/H(+) antiporter subunit G [Deltaproteobacteria bacterium]|nr:monovalent cation/H(+) antiporter subunit G [Deltaproteobacteria bacterium]MBW2138370.1 monovalent cation/H(+) antiporter subunit G [Deltaproteobacteria bacterium]